MYSPCISSMMVIHTNEKYCDGDENTKKILVPICGIREYIDDHGFVA